MPWHRDRHPRLVIGAEEHFVLQAGAARCTVVACQGAVEWPPESGFIWISCETGANRFYISRTEISNARYQRFVTSEAYATYGLDHKRPRWWNGENNAPPEYHRGGKTLLPDKFPVTGVSPVEAEAFAEEVFGEGTRLPTRDEWLRAAQMGNAGGRLPWKDEEAGALWFNHAELDRGVIWKKRADSMKLVGRETPIAWTPVEVDVDPFGDAREAQTNRSLKILHQMGNVRELVRLGKSFGVVGGGFTDSRNNEQFDLQADPLGYEDFHRNDGIVGFRLVIDLERPPKGFIEEAQK